MIKRDWGFASLRLTAAAILFIAAFAKVWFYPVILKGDGLLSKGTALDLAIVFESVAAVVIAVSNVRLSWWLIASIFGCFAVVSTLALVTGRDCNCFGEWFGARVTLPIDLAITIACVLFRIRNPNLHRDSHASSRLIPFGIVGLIVGIGLVSGGHLRLQTSTTDDGTRFLFASDMIGKPWPIDSRLNPLLRELESGKWLVIVARRDCDHCARILQEYFSDPRWHPAETRTILFVAGSNEWSFCLDLLSLIETPAGIVSWSIEPFVSSPAIFLLNNGVVEEAADGPDADGFASRLLQIR